MKLIKCACVHEENTNIQKHKGENNHEVNGKGFLMVSSLEEPLFFSSVNTISSGFNTFFQKDSGRETWERRPQAILRT